MKSRSVAHGQNERAVTDIRIGSWDRRVLTYGQGRNGVAELVPKVGIAASASISSPPIRVHGELSQIRETAEGLVSSRRLAAGQRAKRIKVRDSGALGCEVSVEKVLVGQFIFRVVGDVLIHVAVEHLYGVCVVEITSGSRRGIARDQLACQQGNFSILNAGQFVVLQPDVALDNFSCGDETENGRIALAN